LSDLTHGAKMLQAGLNCKSKTFSFLDFTRIPFFHLQRIFNLI
jgi:hypothetical protein